MKLEKLEPSARAKDRILAHLEDGSVLTLTEQELLDYSLCAGDELDAETLEKLRASAAYSSAKKMAAVLVSRKAMSRADLVRKLQEKGAGEEEAVRAADWLADIGVLNDQNYAGLLLRHYANRCYGEGRVREELRRHGVDRELWDDVLAEMPPAEESILRFLKQRWEGIEPSEKDIRRMTDTLLRRGFSWGDVKQALRVYTELTSGEES